MTQGLYDAAGNRKYLVEQERLAFVQAALAEGGAVATFCLTLAFTGARISEVLALTPRRIDVANGAIVFETLKRRKRGIYRALPVPLELVRLIAETHEIEALTATARLWPWGRTTAWKRVKRIMQAGDIAEPLCMPKALRHAFAVEAGQNGVQLNIVQRWLGHARIETTSIYASALGKEERALAQRTWQGLQRAMNAG
jgi:site-specific recombinase XerD